MKKNIIYLFIALITLLLVGCGGSSPDNPLSSNVNSGLVNISGNVKNSTGNGSVSFYAPTAAAKNCLNVTNSFRASVANEGIYRFNTDENGNYSGQIPAGDYYIIAQNSDGTMKYVSSKQSFNSSRATTEVKQDITLNKTVNISGKIVPSDYVSFSNNDFSSIPLYIEGYPFMAVTDLEGKFEFSSVPCLTEADSEANSYYTIKSTINLDGIVFFATEVLSYTNFTNGTYKNLELAFVLDEDEVLKEYKTINGKVYNNNGANKEPVGNHLVVGVLSSGQIKYGLTDEEGKFSLIIKANETFADISADLHTFTHITEFTSVIEDKFENLLYTDSGSGSGSSAPIFHSILFTEPPSEGLKANGEAILTIYKKTSNNKYVFYKEERVYLPLDKYAVSDLEIGEYSYMIANYDYQSDLNGFSMGDFEVKESVETTEVTNTNKMSAYTPKIIASGYGQYSAYIKFTPNQPTGEVKVFSIIEKENGGETYNTLTTGLDNDNATVATIALDNLETGEYDLYAGYSVSYKGIVATITSDPFPYVKH